MSLAASSLTVIFGRQLRTTADTTLVFWQLVAGLTLGLASLPFFGWTHPTVVDTP